MLFRRLVSSIPPQSLGRCSSQALPRPLPTTRSISSGRQLRPRKRQSFRTLAGFQRHLATALDECPPIDNLSFEALANGSPQEHASLRRPLYELRPFDTSSPLVVRDASLTVPRQRLNAKGIPGELDEMLSVFDACVEVGKFDRAALVLQRLQSIELLSPEAMVELHNCFLHGRVFEIQSKPSLDGAEDVHKWFEKRIRSIGLPHTPETIAYMLKASLLTARGSRLERLVDRYMAMLPEETALESLFMTEVLDARELATLAELSPSYNMPGGVMPPDLAVDTVGKTELAAEEDVSRVNMSPKPTPEVLGTPQKGLGLESLKQTLSLFTTIPSGFNIAALSKAEQREVQARLERDCVESALLRWREEHSNLMDMGLNTSVSSHSLGPRLYEWQSKLEAHLIEELKLVEAAELAEKKGQKDLDRCQYGPFLRLSTPSRLSAVTILGTLSLLAMVGGDKGVPLVTVIYHVAKVAEQDIRSQVAASGSPTRKMAVQKGGARRLMQLAKKEEMENNTADQKGATIAPNERPAGWPTALKFKVGAALLSGLLESAKLTVTGEHPVTKARVSQLQPAFLHSSQLKKGKKIGVLVPNPALTDLLKREPNCDLLARHLPMVCEPEPWAKFEKGGFIESPVSLVRTKQEERDQIHYAEAAIGRGDMDQVMKGLDVLGKTAWRINRPILDIMLEAWNSGEAIADIPALNPKIAIPLEPEASDDPLERRRWMKQVRIQENERSGQHSVRCFLNFQLEIARAYRDQSFYFPHNVDFRGRAYPIPAYLNHMGADNVRGLLMFAEGKELGDRGLRWLKIHLANVYGFDKATFNDREQFAVDNYDNIIDSVQNPLNGKRWWLEAEDPWQCLATCHELKAAMESPDPTKFISHLPVHQDGTCNGLQHYAALGGDVWGAEQVNLVPGDKPADVYSAVASMVSEAIDAEAKQGSPFAAALQGKIKRKVVKQTVMTNVYGVTFMGAKKQVLRQLDNLYPTLSKDSGLEAILCASYIATHIFKALSTMFRGAHDIQHYLCEIGGRVCDSISPERIDSLARTELDQPKRASPKKTAAAAVDEAKGEFHSTIIWTTPLRMPVVQPYRKSTSKIVQTCLQTLVLTTPDKFDPVDKGKQLQGFPPNFIHSLDASHMLLSALECESHGLTFASVHDSFWTHAADVDEMGRILRDAFIRIHSEDVIGRLKAEFEARYKGHLYRTRLLKSSPVGQAITEHRKKARLTPLKELVLEKQRLDLLASQNPQDVKKGQKMVTPGSIFAQLGGAPEDVVGTDSQAALEELGAEDGEDGMTAEKEAQEEGQDPVLGSEGHPFRGGNLLALHLEKATRAAPAKSRVSQMIHIWLPLTFPEVPAKGNFDVRVLRDSPYFFN